MVIASLFAAHHAIKREERYSQIIRLTEPMSLPTANPSVSQESIDLALKLYDIRIPEGASHPKLDLRLTDRGMTTLYGANSRLEVLIGPGAFASWGLLGSTLAHELEVHCRQSFTWIRLLDMVGLEGTMHAERSAYVHELNEARRFGLNRTELASISETMNFYYPEAGQPDSFASRISKSVQQLIAK